MSTAPWRLAFFKEQGYEISGAYIRTWNEEIPLADCPAQQDIEDSRAVATPGIDYEIVNLVNEYESMVNYLVDGYQRVSRPTQISCVIAR